MKQLFALLIIYFVSTSGYALSGWDVTATDKTHTIFIKNTDTEGQISLIKGDKIGFFYDSLGFLRCAGWAYWDGSPLSITVYGKSGNISGYDSGEVFKVRVLREGCVKPATATFEANKNKFKIGGESTITELSCLDLSINYPLEFCHQDAFSPLIPSQISAGELRFVASPSGLQIDKDNGTINLKSSQPKTYIVSIETDLCLEKKSFTLTLRPKPISGLQKTYYLCSDPFLIVNAKLNFKSYRWSDGTTGSFASISKEGNYWLEYMDVNGCYWVDTFTVVKAQVELKKIESKKINCRTVELYAPSGWLYYEWSNGERTPTATIQSPGSYFVKLTSSQGCQVIQSISIEEQVFEAEAVSLQIDKANCNQGGTLKVDPKSHSGLVWPVSYELTNLVTGRIIRFKTETLEDIPVGSYTFLATDAVGCSSQPQRVDIVRNYDCNRAVITPDGDGVDDFIYIPIQGVAKIYDKFGALINQISIPSKWDGRDGNNLILPVGAYLIVCNGSESIEITLIR